jgi:hypothetical protein
MQKFVPKEYNLKKFVGKKELKELVIKNEFKDSLLNKAKDNNFDLYNEDFSLFLDKNDELSHFKDKFHIPKHNDKEILYFTGIHIYYYFP